MAEEISSVSEELKNAPKHVQLAVDLIYLLESNNLDKTTILKALEIVKQDFESKQA